MNTITIDSNTYNSIEQYARQNHMSVTEAVVTGLNTFLGKFKAKVLTSSLKKHAFYNLLINNILYLCVT